MLTELKEELKEDIQKQLNEFQENTDNLRRHRSN
jgi:t-SNARE complex subunit (syntaxin)